jgi:oxygen-dependent protoporphyrinogen oxidase
MPPLRVAVIGGGIAGLSAGWYLERQAETDGLNVQYTLLEMSDRWGGRILTEYVEGFGDEPFVVEGGPDSFFTQKPWALQLMRELGMDDRLLGTNDHLRKTFVLNKGKPTPLPDGVLLIIPTKIMPFVRSPLISPWGKLRMGLEMFIPAKRDGEDETLAEFIKRRLGAEALDKIAEPLMSGIYNAEADRQSLLATFPRFRALEEKYGNLTRGMLESRKLRANAPKRTGPAASIFVSLKAGAQELTDELASRLAGDLRLNTKVQSIEHNGTYRLDLSDGSSLEVDAVIIATPAYAAAELLRELAPQAATELDKVRYVSTGTISLGFRRAEVEHPLDGFGVVVPRSEKRPINAITWSSTKFNYRAPEGCVLLRAFFGGSRSPESMDLDDDKLLATVRKELQEIMGIDAEPLFHRIYRFGRSNPQYDVGHLDRVATIEAALPPDLYVTGSPYRGIGIPDCVHQSQQTVEKIFSIRSPALNPTTKVVG